MSDRYRIFGSEMSPYSVKVRSYCRYKGIPHEWIRRTPQNQDEYRKYARIPIIPAVATPDDVGLQDSTPIIDRLEGLHPEPSVHPDDAVLAFLSVLVEEYGDEWGNKIMFHHRWWHEADQRACARILARGNLPEGDEESVDALAAQIRERMTGRGDFVGSNPQTAPLISRYLDDLLEILEPHLAGRRYLFGDRPAYGDFGLAMQLYEASIDPTAGGIMRARSTNVLDWCFRMIEPRDDGPFESWESLAPTLTPLLQNIGGYFLPWSVANAKALQAGEESFSVELAGSTYTQPPQKYHAKSLGVLRERYAALDDTSSVDPILESTGCLSHLR
ncbi:MAG: glutathione S-transferase family protein [Acidobacteriota bacterium]|nr:glutathione S-transferase family protein [Acidobacteriota bacterium]